MYPKSSKSITSRSSAILAEAMKSPKKDSYPRTPVKNKARKSTDVQEPKAESSFNPTPATDSSRMLKDNSNFVSESLFNQTIGAEHSSLSTINMPEDGKEAGLNMTPERYVKKLQEENAALRMELTEKNAMNTKLIKDNANLRHEMEQFLSTVNDAREYIDLELKECNQRIQDLEAEMQELRVENALYKEQLARQKESSRGKSLKMNEPPAQEVQGVYSNALKDVEDFYSKLNGQITDFLDNSKKQQQEFSKTIQSKMQESQVSVSELPKSSVSISTNYSPGRQVPRPKTPTSMTRADTFRIQGTMTPGRRNTMARKTLDNFVTKANEVNVSPSYRLVKGRAGHASSNQFELLGQEESMGSISQDLGRSKKSVASVVSPKTGLKTKLKSDIILQEMKKKLIS